MSYLYILLCRQYSSLFYLWNTLHEADKKFKIIFQEPEATKCNAIFYQMENLQGVIKCYTYSS